MPRDLREWLPQFHMAFTSASSWNAWTSRGSTTTTTNDGHGCVPYDPSMMVTIILYAYATGINSAMEMARLFCNDVAFRFLAASNNQD